MQNKNLIQKLGYKPKENSTGIFYKKYAGAKNYLIEVDLEKEKFNYGKLIKTGTQSTLNFTQAENWVVFECVDRLLEKGYQPQHISLEKVYPAGHGFSGRLDICVTRSDDSEYLLIECKTLGKEFDKALTKLHKDGGQLFTYFKFSNKADVVMLYASELNKNEIVYKNEIVKIENDYRTGDVKDFFEKWNKLTKDNGIFNTWVNPYEFISKALTPKLLIPIRQEDSNFIFIRFLEILRNNVVSDEGNAFNKIFTLFLCKVYDEKSTKDNEELKFQWFEGKDDDISFQLRLTDLYKNGMLEFLEKEVSDFTEDAFEDKFKHLKPEDKKDLLYEIHKLRLEKNNEFAIKEVFDHQSFKENAKVVKQVVELLQGFRIRYNKRQQYLSDFFELLLTTGLKQKVGQYFTPVPIAQFIIKSLPIDTIVDEKLEKGERNNLLPFVIDYAAGSGHFLTESMHEIQRLLDKKVSNNYISDTAKKIKTWQDDHFDWATRYVYGIEKDYRLVKVGKVGCYLHGDGLANVILSDGLANFTNTKEYKGLLKKTDADFPKENKQFDIVLSNPPYSVPAFRLNAREFYTEKDFELYKFLTDQSSQIETLFIERTQQLLKDGGIAGIVLPNTVLSTESYIRAREMILQFFDIISIAELGANTFMATQTGTVVLFLKRKNNYVSKNIRIAVDKFFVDHLDVTINQIERPVSEYVKEVWGGITFKDYVSLLQKKPNKAIESSEIYKNYQKKIKAKNENEFWDLIILNESEKVFYFIIAFPQTIVLVKTGQKSAERKFLGYEFSSRRGRQGIHPIQNGKNIEDCTSLFDPQIFDNPNKASSYIYKAFAGDLNFPIVDALKNNVSRHRLVDMITFDRFDFEKTISLSVKKKVNITSKWELKKINEVSNINYGTRIVKKDEAGSIYPVYGGGGETFKADSFNRENAFIISRFGMSPECVRFVNGKFFLNDSGMTLDVDKDIISQKYLDYYIFLNQDLIYDCGRGLAQKNMDIDALNSIQIPIPTKSIQNKIIAEIENIEQKEIEAVQKSLSLINRISEKFKNLPYQRVELESVASFKNGLNYSRSSTGEKIKVIGVKDFQDNFTPDIELLEEIQIDGALSEDYKLNLNDLLVVRSNGSANLVGRFLLIQSLKGVTSYSGFTIRIRPDLQKINSKFLCHYLRTDFVREELVMNSKGSNIKSLNQPLLSSIKIPLPSLKEQAKIISEIEILEKQISQNSKEIAFVSTEMKKVLKKYL